MSYIVTWSGSIEREGARAQQRPAEHRLPKDHVATDVIAACLEENPGATVRGLADLTGLSRHLVNSVLFNLLKQGRVERTNCHAENAPVQWRIRS